MYQSEVRCDSCPQSLFFLRSVYFLMQTLFTIGYGDSVAPSRSHTELILACIFMLFGVFGYGLIIANMTSVLSNLDVISMRFRNEMDNISRWLLYRSVLDTQRSRLVFEHDPFLSLFCRQSGLGSEMWLHLLQTTRKTTASVLCKPHLD